MATRSMQSDSWANAAANIGEALFPNGRTVAQGKIAGQTLAELAARTRKGQAEAEGLEGQNSAFGTLADVITNPMVVKLLQAGRGNSQQLMEAMQTNQQMVGDQSAAEAFGAGDYVGANAGRLSGGRDPFAVNKIESGYQINPLLAGGEATPTGETMADILATNALADQREASAGYDRERTTNPERFRAAPAAKGPEISTAETNALANEIVRFLPKDTPAEDVMAATAAASQRMLRGQTPAEAIQGGVADVFETVPEHTTGGDDWVPFNEETVPAQRRRKAVPTSGTVPPRGRTPEMVRADYQAGKITREAAKSELLQMGFE